MIRKYICVVCLFFTIGYASDDFSRELTTVHNPDFPKACTDEGLQLVYTRGVSTTNKNDVLHFVITAGKPGPPTLILIHSLYSKDAKLVFNCSMILSSDITMRRKGIQMKPEVNHNDLFTAGFVMSRMWEYNDTKDIGNMTIATDNSSLVRIYSLDEFAWDVEVKQHSVLLTTNSTKNNSTAYEEEEEEEAVVEISNEITTKPTSKPTPAPHPKGLFSQGGKLSLLFSFSGAESRRNILPRLSFTGNSTQLDVGFNNLNPTYNGSRFALTIVQMYTLSSNASKNEVDDIRSVDDEFTPGIFKIFNWRFFPSQNHPATRHDRSFLQWKPICYTSNKRQLSESQQMFNYPPLWKIDEADLSLMDDSPVHPWFSPTPSVHHRFEALSMNISFGQTDDGFYPATNYTVWSASMGLGDPPVDHVSMLVILIIVIGLGLPVIIIFAGFIAVLVRRRRLSQAPSTYQVIN